MRFYPARAHQHGSTLYSSATADCTGSRQQAAASKCGEIGSAAFSVVTGPRGHLQICSPGLIGTNMSTVAYVSRGSYVPGADTRETIVYLHRDKAKTEKRSKDIPFGHGSTASYISSIPREQEHLEYVSVDITNNFDKESSSHFPLYKHAH